MKIIFNKLYSTDNELKNIAESLKRGRISGDGYFTKLCHQWLAAQINRKVLLTHSCTAALEMMAILIDIAAGDEVIMPSYTFASTANAFVLRGAVPVFVDIRPDTLNLDERLVEQAITARTKAVVAVHYAGVSCAMDELQAICKNHNLYLFEDAAQGFDALYKGKPLGTIGDLGTYSFHETKNIIAGEGGCLIINNENFATRAEIIREKGTNRSSFIRGEVDKYTWVDTGSSYLPSDIIAAFLYAQLENSKTITTRRLQIWEQYNMVFKQFEQQGKIKCPFIPNDCIHNAHMYYVLCEDLKQHTKFMNYLQDNDIVAVTHYIPLHSSPAGLRYGRVATSMNITNKVAQTLVRMPLFYELSQDNISHILDIVNQFFSEEL